MNFLIVGLNHNTSPQNIREQFSWHGDALDKNLATLLSQENIKEAVIFSNQDMVEIYTVAVHYETALASIKQLLGSYHDRRLGELDNIIYSYNDQDAIRHLFYVAYGFESMLVDDPDILHQLNDAFTYCLSHNPNAKFTNNIIENAITIAESKELSRIKTQYLSSGSIISFAATEITKKLFYDITALNLLLIGAGVGLAEDGVRSLANSGIKEFVVINKSYETACKNADKLHGRAVPIDNLLDELLQADIVISSTHSPYYVISMDHISHVMEQRLKKPILLIDISVPRNIDPKISDIENVYLYDVDDMGVFSDEYRNAYQKGNDQIKAIIDKEAELFWDGEMSK